MGDRTTVDMIVRAADFQRHEALFEDPHSNEVFSNGLLCLTYHDVDCASLDFEAVLREKRIPYDKDWGNGAGYTSGSEYCRVLSNGSVDVQKSSGEGRHSIDLNEAIKAYQQGQIADFLQTAKRERDPIFWDDQEIILQRREQTSEKLEQLAQEALDDLVVEMCCGLSCQSPDGINSREDPEDQEVVLFAAESQASEINNNGREAQITYLLNGGYLSEGLAQHHVPEFHLEEGQSYEHYRVVALSSGHITEDDRDALADAVTDGDQMVLQREAGFFLKLFEEDTPNNYRHGHSEALNAIIRWAHQSGYRMIEFDRDADLLPQFPVFDW